jgi:hypothetical protein
MHIYIYLDPPLDPINRFTVVRKKQLQTNCRKSYKQKCQIPCELISCEFKIKKNIELSLHSPIELTLYSWQNCGSFNTCDQPPRINMPLNDLIVIFVLTRLCLRDYSPTRRMSRVILKPRRGFSFRVYSILGWWSVYFDLLNTSIIYMHVYASIYT